MAGKYDRVLTAMLKPVEAKVRQVCCFRVIHNSEYTAFISKMIVLVVRLAHVIGSFNGSCCFRMWL